MKPIKKCQICQQNLNKILDFGKQPLCDDLKSKPNKCKFYKLQIFFCKNCLTAFQRYNVNKKILFPKNYHYRSANTKDVLNGMKNLVDDIENLKNNNLKKLNVLDVGCNDGSLLDFFKKKGCKTYGLEPTGAYIEAKKKGHKVFNDYINLTSAKKIKQKLGKIHIITFTNVFAHIENLNELLTSLKTLITNETILVIENHYLGEVIKKKQFDTFYHEHPRTYSLKSFLEISKLLDMKIIKHKFVKRYNGNIRVFLKKSGDKKYNNEITKYLLNEQKFVKKFELLQKKVKFWIIEKKKVIKNLNKKFGPLPAKAFPGRASILINLLKLNNKNIYKIYEKNSSLKINKYVPGTNIIIKTKKI